MDFLKLIDATKIPILAPPPGVTPNFINPQTRAYLVITTVAVCLAVVTPLVFARMYARTFIIRKHGWDDYLSLISWLYLIGFCVLILYLTTLGVGAHTWDIPLSEASANVKFANINEICYGPLVCIIKLSILFQFLRIFMPTHSGLLYWATHLIIWSNILLYLASVFVKVFQCIPRQKIWNPLLPGHCLNGNIALVVTAALNIGSDLAIFMIPVTAIWQLQMRTRRKFGVAFVFGMGILCCVCSVMRLIASINFARTSDWGWLAVPLVNWSIAELSTGLIVGCLPSVPKFYNHFAHILSSKLSAIRFKKSADDSSTTQRSENWDPIQDQHAPQEDRIALNVIESPAPVQVERVDSDLEAGQRWESDPETRELTPDQRQDLLIKSVGIAL